MADDKKVKIVLGQNVTFGINRYIAGKEYEVSAKDAKILEDLKETKEQKEARIKAEKKAEKKEQE